MIHPSPNPNLKLILDYLKTAPYKTTQALMVKDIGMGKQQVHYTIGLLKQLDLINEVLDPDINKRTLYYSLKDKTDQRPKVSITL